MSQRVSGFERQAGDQYMTPEWPVETLLHVTPFVGEVWEPACGEGAISRVISRQMGNMVSVRETDIDPAFCQREHCMQHDFITAESGFFLPEIGPFAIVTNPPYGNGGKLAERFVRLAVEMTQFNRGRVAMLLPVDWDAAKTRHDLFEDFPGHVTKITLTERIRWTNLPQSKSGPSQNHAWFVWDHGRIGRDVRWLGRISG